MIRRVSFIILFFFALRIQKSCKRTCQWASGKQRSFCRKPTEKHLKIYLSNQVKQKLKERLLSKKKSPADLPFDIWEKIININVDKKKKSATKIAKAYKQKREKDLKKLTKLFHGLITVYGSIFTEHIYDDPDFERLAKKI